MSDIEKLAQLYMFQHVPRHSLDELCALAPPVRFAPGHTVFDQGAPADVALLVIEGRLVASVGAGGDEKQLGDIRAGEVVGEQGLFVPGGQRSAKVTAAEPSTCLLLSPDVMDHAAHNPAIVALEQHLLGSLARRIRKTNQAIQQAWRTTPEAAPSAEPRRRTLRERLATLFGGR